MGCENKKLGLLELSAVREITNIGMGHAIMALNGLTQKNFNMSVPSADSVALTQIPTLLGDESIFAGIYMEIAGDVGGHMAMLYPWSNAQSLWSALLGSCPASPEDVTDLEASALIEIGNIVNGSFLNAIAEMTGFSMLATPPALGIDFSVVLLDAIVAEASLGDHVALAIETDLYFEGDTSSGMFLFIPTAEGLQSVFKALGIAEAA